MTSKGAYIASDATSLDRRTSSAAIAKRLVRKRLLKTSKDGVDRCQVDGTNVVYRNQGVPYVTCEFLDDHETIIVADERSYMDIIRLPRYEGTDTTPTRPLGRVVSKDISLCLDRSEAFPPICRKIRSFQNGKLFAVGLDDGEFQIFSTERAMPWWESRHQQFGLEKTFSTSFHNYITSAFKVNRPRRKYNRHFTLSLAEQLRNPTAVESQLEELSEFVRIYSPSHWDFREISCGSIQAVNVGDCRDFFALRILDSRTPQSQYDVCVDLQMIPGGNSISEICFLNDNTVATIDDRYSEIKIWDIRMIERNKNQPSMFLPSFPFDHAHGFGTKDYSSLDFKPFHDQKNIDNVSELLEFGHCSLTLLHDGNLIASICGDYCSNHSVVDPIKMTTVAVVNTSQDTAQFAIDRQYGYVATYSPPCSYDEMWSRIRFFAPDCMGSDCVGIDNTNRKRRKRENHNAAIQNKSDNFEIETHLCDRDGLKTTVSCMSFNDSGSSLIATSEDGNVFLWRAS